MSAPITPPEKTDFTCKKCGKPIFRVVGWAHYTPAASVASYNPPTVLVDHFPEPAETTDVPKFEVQP